MTLQIVNESGSGLSTVKLPRVSPAQARLARTTRDRRFAPWLARVAGHGSLQPSRSVADDGTLELVLRCDAGRIGVAIGAGAWPALRMIAALGDARLATQTAAELLAEPLAWFARDLPGLRVDALRVNAVLPAGSRTAARYAWPAVEWRGDAGTCTLFALDEGVAACLGDAVRDTARASKRHLARLRVPGRVRLFVQRLHARQLRSLVPGDVVVWRSAAHSTEHSTEMAASRLPSRLSFGMGTTMQAAAHIENDRAAIVLAEAPRAADEEAQAADAPGPDLAALGELGLPVSFEIDSARVTLDELASLDAGSVLALEAPLNDATVRLVCFGQVVGSGQLVAVGERLGVRIMRMGPRATIPAG